MNLAFEILTQLLNPDESGGAITGVLAATEGSDVASFDASVIVTGDLSATEGSDTSDFNGSVIITGSISAVEGSDQASLSGTVIVSGSIAVTEGADVASLSGTVSSASVTGTLSVTEGPDTSDFTGTVADTQSIIYGGGGTGFVPQGTRSYPDTGRKKDHRRDNIVEFVVRFTTECL